MNYVVRLPTQLPCPDFQYINDNMWYGIQIRAGNPIDVGWV